MSKRNPADATLRNVRAAKKRDDSLTDEVARLRRRVGQLEGTVRAINDRLGTPLDLATIHHRRLTDA